MEQVNRLQLKASVRDLGKRTELLGPPGRKPLETTPKRTREGGGATETEPSVCCFARGRGSRPGPHSSGAFKPHQLARPTRPLQPQVPSRGEHGGTELMAKWGGGGRSGVREGQQLGRRGAGGPRRTAPVAAQSILPVFRTLNISHGEGLWENPRKREVPANKESVPGRYGPSLEQTPPSTITPRTHPTHEAPTDLPPPSEHPRGSSPIPHGCPRGSSLGKGLHTRLHT